MTEVNERDGKELVEAINSGELKVFKEIQFCLNQTPGEVEVINKYYVFPSKKLDQATKDSINGVQVLKKEKEDD